MRIAPIILSVACLAAHTLAAPLAFPTAEGYGKNVSGGRGGKVYEVTTLNFTGAGSLSEAIAASGARTIVFRVSGTIIGNVSISKGDLTIAGQTAPGDGITIKGNFIIRANNVIVRYIRVRNDPVKNPDTDAISAVGQENIILDHVSTSWGTDEVMSIYLNKNVTIQWCIIAEACGKGGGHEFAGIWGNENSTYHHNLLAHCVSRLPRWASGGRTNDYRNNVIYNWTKQNCYGGELIDPHGRTYWNSFTVNMIANYYKSGPATASAVRSRIANPSARSGNDKGSWYVSGNYVDGFPDVTADNWKGISGNNYIKLSSPWNAMPINQQSPADAYTAVLEKVGCSLPSRDAVDLNTINDVRNRTGKNGNMGIIKSPSEAGGWPALKSGTPPADSDRDGMSDDWEKGNGLNPNDPKDGNATGKDGYTNLELYLAELAGDFTSTTAVLDHNTARSTLVNVMTSFNPTLKTLNVQGNGAGLRVEIFSLDGKVVLAKQITPENSLKNVEIPLSSLKGGIYLIKSECNGSATTSQIHVM